MDSTHTLPESIEVNPDSAKILRRASNELNSELTPGLIHEVNNVLTGIYFNLESCSEAFDATHPLADVVQEINCGVERIKELLGRTTQIHLNVAEREMSYHDLEALVAAQFDLLRIVFPKTAKISLNPPSVPVHARVAELPFRVVMLTIASRLKGLFPVGKIDIPISILSPGQLQEVVDRSSRNLSRESVAVSFTLPCPVDSSEEIDEYLCSATQGDISLEYAEKLITDMGGELMFCPDVSGNGTDLLFILPSFNINS
jgi:hypothetical protein